MGCASVSKEAFDEAAKPVSKDFLLGPEDVLEVSVWRNQDPSRSVVVCPDGKFSLPLIGDVQASGLNASQVAAKIAARLSEFKENPNVSVSLKEVNSHFIYVLLGSKFRTLQPSDGLPRPAFLASLARIMRNARSGELTRFR